MKIKVPGLAESTGVKAVDFTLPASKPGEMYVFEIGLPTSKMSERSPCLVNNFPMVVIDGPEDEKTGKSTQGRKFFYRVNILLPEYDSFNPANTRSADELADLCKAADVDFDEEGFDPEDFVGKKVKAALGIRNGKDQDGNERPENTIKQTKDEDGTIHLWLSDDGKAVKRSASSPAKKPSASKRR
jgi:hypothetical protein